MTDFAANIHFRPTTLIEVAGGYVWFLGRHADWQAFEHNIRQRLHELGYYFVECVTLIELTCEADVNEGEQRGLYRLLATQPTQCGTLHTYTHDDA